LDFQPAIIRICAGTQAVRSITRILDGSRPFCSCDLDIDPMTFIYELGRIACLEILYELPTSRLSKVIMTDDRQRQTESNERLNQYITTPLRGWSTVVECNRLLKPTLPTGITTFYESSKTNTKDNTAAFST